MKQEHIKYLVCPRCKSELKIKVKKEVDGKIKDGMLICKKCNVSYPIIKFIPRFVPLENYASSFGYQWNKLGYVQYDSFTKKPITEERFFKSTKWEKDLKGEIILEVGSGAGRFTEIAAKTGAFVVSIDYSNAVETNYRYNGNKDNVLIVQANIYEMPFRDNYFDRIFCFGVLQHLPDVKKGFFSLIPLLKINGRLAIDVYKISLLRKLFYTKYWIRPITKRVDKQKLFNFIEKWVNFWWPKTRWISKNIPKGRFLVKNFLFIADYTGAYDLEDDILKTWAILDTFDMLSPAYDNPQTLKTVRKWFEEGRFEEIEVEYGYNGIVGRGIKK